MGVKDVSRISGLAGWVDGINAHQGKKMHPGRARINFTWVNI